MTTQVQEPATVSLYNVRFVSSTALQSHLVNEQFRRYKKTGKKEKLMDIACEWLEEKAKEEDMKAA